MNIYSFITDWLISYELQRKYLVKKVPKGPLKKFLSTPFPSPQTLINDTPILSVDFETTGLNARQDKLLSVGFVSMENMQIHLAKHSHEIIRSEGALDADNVIIHQITDDLKEQGLELRVVIENLLQALTGKVMLVHFARIEKQFLNQACRELYGFAPVFPIIDTLVIAKRQLDRTSVPYDPSQLRLTQLRQQYALPKHYAHNALNDAIATAELFLALINSQFSNDEARLKSVLL